MRGARLLVPMMVLGARGELPGVVGRAGPIAMLGASRIRPSKAQVKKQPDERESKETSTKHVVVE